MARIIFPHLEEAIASVVDTVARGLAAHRSICVIVPSRHDAAAVLAALDAARHPGQIIGPEERDQPDSKVARIATMHRAKGLEFDEIILLTPAQPHPSEVTAEDFRRLQYVASPAPVAWPP